MAKKNLSSLVNGIMGGVNTDIQVETTKKKPSSNADAIKEHVTDSEIMTTSFRAPKILIRKLRMIAGAEGVGVGSIIQAAFEMYINKWEDENGKLLTK